MSKLEPRSFTTNQRQHVIPERFFNTDRNIGRMLDGLGGGLRLHLDLTDYGLNFRISNLCDPVIYQFPGRYEAFFHQADAVRLSHHRHRPRLQAILAMVTVASLRLMPT